MIDTSYYEIPAYVVPHKSERAQYNFDLLYNEKDKQFIWSNDAKCFALLKQKDLFVVINENENVRKLILCKKGECIPITSYNKDDNISFLNDTQIKGDFSKDGFFISYVLEVKDLPQDFNLRNDLKGMIGNRLIDLHDSKHRTKLNYLRQHVTTDTKLFKFLSRDRLYSGIIPLHEKDRFGNNINSFLYYKTENDYRQYLKQIIIKGEKIFPGHKYYRDFVYFIYFADTNIYKIGRAQDPFDRSKKFVYGHPDPDKDMQIHLTLVDGRLEQSFHDRFRQYWIQPPVKSCACKEHFSGFTEGHSEIYEYIRPEAEFQKALLDRFKEDLKNDPDCMSIKRSYDTTFDLQQTEFLELQGVLFPTYAVSVQEVKL